MSNVVLGDAGNLLEFVESTLCSELRMKLWIRSVFNSPWIRTADYLLVVGPDAVDPIPSVKYQPMLSLYSFFFPFWRSYLLAILRVLNH